MLKVYYNKKVAKKAWTAQPGRTEVSGAEFSINGY